MPSTTRFTKRQKKGLAFRERKHGKRKNELLDSLDDAIDVAWLEDQALVDAPQGQQGAQTSAETFVGKKPRGKGEETETERVVVAEKKRKVDQEAEGTSGESDQPKSKRRRGSDGRPLDRIEQPVERVGAGEGGEIKGEKRFILFLGNLKYTTTLEAIQAHFSICIPPPTVRLLTPKPSARASTKPIMKSKGCAFLEFKHRGALQQGLKLHHSQLDGRQINVELTAGGGGKGVARMKKLKERNNELEEQRRKRKEPKVETQPKNIQRSSVTPNTKQNDTYEQTRTIGDVEVKGTHQDHQKHQRGSTKIRSQLKEFRTGVNAIPIG